MVCVKTFAFSVTAKNSGSTATDPGVTQTFNLVFDDDWAGKQADLASQVSFKIGKVTSFSIVSGFTANSDTVITTIDSQAFNTQNWVTYDSGTKTFSIAQDKA